MAYNRSTSREALLTFEVGREEFTIRQDRTTPSLFHRKRSWPSGRRYWRPISAGEWAAMPSEARQTILSRFGMIAPVATPEEGGQG